MRRRCARNEAGLNHAQTRVHKNTAVEAGDDGVDFQVVDQHLHPARRPSARDREGDLRRSQRCHRGAGPRSDDLVVIQERSLHNSEHERNSFRVEIRLHPLGDDGDAMAFRIVFFVAG
jgi:hypothetical protein